MPEEWYDADAMIGGVWEGKAVAVSPFVTLVRTAKSDENKDFCVLKSALGRRMLECEW